MEVIVHLVIEDRFTRVCDGRRWQPAPEGKNVTLRLCEECRITSLRR